MHFHAAEAVLAHHKAITQLGHERQAEAEPGVWAWALQPAPVIADMDQKFTVTSDRSEPYRSHVIFGVGVHRTVSDRLRDAEANVVEPVAGNPCRDCEASYGIARERDGRDVTWE